MLHPETLRQFEALKRRFPQSRLRELPSGAALIAIDDFGIDPGWTASSTSIRFLAPAGYPGPNPDCFWASSGLRVTGSTSLPQASADPSEIPEANESGLWFSWHVTDPGHNWNPSRDTLETYLGIIAERFRRPQ